MKHLNQRKNTSPLTHFEFQYFQPYLLGKLIKVVSEFSFGHTKCYFWARKDVAGCPAMSFVLNRYQKYKSVELDDQLLNMGTFTNPTSPKTHGIAIGFKHFPLGWM